MFRFPSCGNVAEIYDMSVVRARMRPLSTYTLCRGPAILTVIISMIQLGSRLQVYREGKWEKLPGDALLPGDILSIGRPQGAISSSFSSDLCRLHCVDSQLNPLFSG